MKKIAITGFIFFLAVALLPAPTAAMTVEEVIDKHIEARGGLNRWSQIETIQMTGSFTAFSKTFPFTLHRTGNDRYHFDHVMDDKKVIIGYDGETAWWENEWNMPGSEKLTGLDLNVQMREFDFPNPLFNYSSKGYKVKLVGDSELEGMPSIAIELTRLDDTTETWHLDPETYLEIGRISPGSDFGNPMEQRTFYDDFRSVDGVMIPHLQEAQWYTQDRLMIVEDVALNLEIDDDLFRMPLPPGMKMVQPMTGAWEVKVEQTQRPGAPWEESTRKASIESLLGGGLIQEKYTTGEGFETVRQITFDRFKNTYRITEIDGHSTQLDVCEGSLEEGRIVASNVETGVTQQGFFGAPLHHQIAIFDVTDAGFKVEEAVSRDGGENWFVNTKLTYSRASN